MDLLQVTDQLGYIKLLEDLENDYTKITGSYLMTITMAYRLLFNYYQFCPGGKIHEFRDFLSSLNVVYNDNKG